MSTAERRARTEEILRTFHEEQAVETKTDFRLLKRLVPYVKKHLKLFVIGVTLLPASALASLVQPLLMKQAIDAAIVTHDAARLLFVTQLFVVAIGVEFVARFVQIYALQLAGQRAVADLRRDAFLHAQTLRMSYFDRTPVGKVVTRVTNDIDALGELFASGAFTAIADILMLVGIVGFMLALDWHLSLIALASIPPLFVIIEILRRKMRVAFREIRARTSQLNAFLSEQVQGVAVVQAFGREDESANDYRRINDGYRTANHKSIRYDALLYSVVEAIAAACIALVLFYAGVRAGVIDDPEKSVLYVGTVVAVYEYIQRFFIPIRDLSTKYTIIQQSLAAAERVFGLLDIREEDAPAGLPIEPPRTGGALVEFRDVSFHYRPQEPVLKDVSFEISRGETIAIVGATGAGKTTITALLLRLYERTTGGIYFEGRDVRAWNVGDLRAQFAVVPQDVFLFAGTVLENVAIGDAVPDTKRALDALERVGAVELLGPRGGDLLGARVDERGGNFSAGEKQLLAFARALYRNPSILVLDEATASVDSATESRLQLAVDELLRERTAIVIAHRLSTIRKASRILVFHHGELMENGSHAELLAQGGLYARLYDLQFGRAVDDAKIE
jgi:ATP-binding cassette subfamily B multidrug efflux pump